MIRSSNRFRTLLGIVFLAVLAIAALAAGCGESGAESEYPSEGVDSTAPPSSSGDFGPAVDAGNGGSDADLGDALGTLVVTPPAATITVTVVNGVVTAPPAAFTASYNGAQVAATWLFDRGELGDVATTGVFTASGKNVGEGTLTARFGAREGTAKIKVVINQTQNGAPNGDAGADAGFGGLGGVGGEPLGGPVDAAVVTKLKTMSTPPANAAELGFLYPYDKTVWPRGLLAPLLMWQTTHLADAVYVKLSQGNYTYEGTFSYAAQPAGVERMRVRIEDLAWRTATQGNQGDPLKVDVKIYSATDDKVYGPITETWTVAAGVLKGTVYYNSYDSFLTSGPGQATGGVIAIKPRSPDPALAVPSQAGKCHVCHELSADGSTLWAQDSVLGVGTAKEYARGASYDLTNPASPRIVYDGTTIDAQNRKFVWSAPYPDGTFALASSGYAREAYLQGDSKLFSRTDGSEVVSTGMNGVVASAVTPAFSPDGRKVAFNFWTGAGGGGVTAGGGRSLAVFDFTCGAPAGSTKCAAAGPRAFSGLREIFKDATTYPSWPSFVPDGKSVVFNNQLLRGNCGSQTDTAAPNTLYNCHITTWFGAKAALWIAKDSASKDARALAAANGIGLPTNADHPNDAELNYQPTVNPVPSGGYYWVVFTSRRMYGNLLSGKPWGNNGDGGGPQKKLWVAAIDINAPAGTDPSHAAFYLPGQELAAGNSRGFWVVDPCKANGNSCESGDECCNGFCRKDPDGGALVCQDKPPGTTCVQEFEKCTVDADCCDPKQKCIAGKCALGNPVVK